jgi:putative salt-induced outer membrane protein YdiY
MTNKPRNLLLMIFVALLCTHGERLHADVLVLKNGDRITGDIKRIWDDEVLIEPEYTDEFNVDLSAVAHIESERNFEIELDSGEQVLATLSGADEDGVQVISTAEGAISVPLADFLELDEPAKAFDFESHIDISASLNKGNTDSYDSKARADMMITRFDHRHLAELTFFREGVLDVPTKEQDLIKYNYNWLFRDPLFFSAQISHESDPIIQLNSRLIISAGLGRDMFNTPSKVLSLQLGAGFQNEDRDIDSGESTVIIWSLRYRHEFIGGDLELFHNDSIVYNVSGRDNTSVKTSTGLRYEITDVLYANFSFDYDYETDPVESAVSEDITLLFGLGAEF